MKKLDRKVAIVTGSSKGIGAEIAKHLAAEGALVVVNYASQILLGRIGQPQDIAPGVVFLASSDSVWSTGATLPIASGFA